VTPKQAHRQAVLLRDGGCRGVPPHGGTLQAHHVISEQRMRDSRSARALRGEAAHPLVQASMDELVADGRNGVCLCELCHGRMHQGALRFWQLPQHVRLDVDEFARQYDFEYTDRGWLPVVAAEGGPDA
jgi:hypothetical protein